MTRTGLAGLTLIVCHFMIACGHSQNAQAFAGEPSDKMESIKTNVRRPIDDADLEYWLQNMVWYHRFTDAEVAAATGLSSAEIKMAKHRFRIDSTPLPTREDAAPLLVLPYPGGRHPRIGFLEGAVHPQRETKFSVFTPWDLSGYVVVDVPEAIWSNLGLAYLAHTHVSTIWDKQEIKLEKMEWRRRAGGHLDLSRTLPNDITFAVRVSPQKDAVRMEMTLTNGTQATLSDLRVQNCVMLKRAVGFEQQFDSNKVFFNPYVAVRSKDGSRWIITAWDPCHRPWANPDCPCMHSDPKFPNCEPGQAQTLRGWLSFYEGRDIQAEFERIEGTGWRTR